MRGWCYVSWEPGRVPGTEEPGGDSSDSWQVPEPRRPTDVPSSLLSQGIKDSVQRGRLLAPQNLREEGS